MTDSLDPPASNHLPLPITAPGEIDVLMVITAIVFGTRGLGLRILFLRLHSLPEQIAHRSRKLQFEIVVVLDLIALFTHKSHRVAGLLRAQSIFLISAG